eukprot:scaffold207_cov409-Prasinococcus_capsulatus_cf.AAC.82
MIFILGFVAGGGCDSSPAERMPLPLLWAAQRRGVAPPTEPSAGRPRGTRVIITGAQPGQGTETTPLRERKAAGNGGARSIVAGLGHNATMLPTPACSHMGE